MVLFEVINCLMYLCALLVYWRKNKDIDAYFLLFGGFTITSIICLAYQNTGKSPYKDTTLIPYIYLFICLLICLRPFKGLNIGSLANVRDNFIIKLLTYVYIVSGILSIYYTLPKTILLYQTDEWDLLRQSLYAGEDMELYGSAFERLCKNIHSYIEPFGVIMCFFELTKKKSNKLLIVLLFGNWLINGFLGATLVASRGIVLNLLLNFGLILIIFKDVISKKIKIVISSLSVLMAVPAVLYLIAVSVSRFGEEDASSSSFMYMGHAMQCFNTGIMGSMHDYAWGKYAFSYFLDNKNLDLRSLGNTSNHGFYTFIGDFYIDWGPFLTIFLCILLSSILSYFAKKRKKNLSDMVILVYFAMFFMKGMFVYGKGYALSWVMLGVVWLLIRIVENRQVTDQI